MQPLYPLTICGIVLFIPSGHFRQLACIHQEDFEPRAFQNFVGSNPVDSGALHGYRFDIAIFEPLRHSDQFRRRGSKIGCFAAGSVCGWSTYPVPFAPKINASYTPPNHRQPFNLHLASLITFTIAAALHIFPF
jgi:hypothetical protein